MNVGMVSDSFSPIVGGAEIHVEELSKALQKKGHQVEVLTCTDGPDSIGNIPVTRLQYSPWNSDTGPLTLVKDDLATFLSFIRRQDVIHAHYTYFSAATAGLLSKIAGKPIVVTLHGLGTLESSVSNSRKMRTFRKISFSASDRVLSTSKEMIGVANRFVDRNNIEYVPNGVDTSYFDPDSVPSPDQGDQVTILSVRRLHPKNGVQYLVDASPEICSAIGNVDIVIAGNGGKEDMMEYLQDRVRQHGTSDTVSFLGEVPNEQTRTLYQSADVVVFPSSAESTSIACLEAMSMECAVVASDLDAYRSLLGDSERGALVELFDRGTSDYDAPRRLPDDQISSLASAIVDLVNDPSRRSELGSKAREYVISNHDWSAIAARIEAVYDEVVQ